MDSRAETLAGDKERSVSPSPLPSFTKEEKIDTDDQHTDNEGSLKEKDPASQEENEPEYPTGAKMLAIVVALCLSIFLVCTSPQRWSSAAANIARLPLI
jgi:hypothetical protein